MMSARSRQAQARVCFATSKHWMTHEAPLAIHMVIHSDASSITDSNNDPVPLSISVYTVRVNIKRKLTIH